MGWFSKKQKSGKVSHFQDKKKIRSDADIEPEDLSVVSDLDIDFTEEKRSSFTDGNYRDDKPEGIEDLNSKQRRQVEDYVGSPIVLVHDDDITKPSFVFANDQEWVVYKSANEAEEDIKKTLMKKLRDYPEMFDSEWLDQYRMLGMSESNREKKAEEEANKMTKFAHRSELFHLAESFGIPVRKELKDDEMRIIIKEGIEKELKHQLQDPVEFYVNMEGIYTINELAKMPWIENKFDYNAAMRDAIDMDGRAYFLSTIDGHEVRLDDMYLYRLR